MQGLHVERLLLGGREDVIITENHETKDSRHWRNGY